MNLKAVPQRIDQCGWQGRELGSEESDSGNRSVVAAPGSDPHAGVLDARVVIVDDDPALLEMLRIHLEDAGHRELMLVQDSTRALDLLRVSSPDLLLTDVRMPRVSGFDLLAQVRADPRLGHLPVIVLTSAGDAATRLQALELGATDFLAKPVDPSELVLRLRNNVAMKIYNDQLAVSRRESDRLLLSILPEPVAERLKRGEQVADHFEEATVLFADLVDFTRFAAQADAATVVRQLNEVFRAFDQLVEARGLEKIKTVGDAYMLAGGVPTRRQDHARAVVEAGLAMRSACKRLHAQNRASFEVRIGVHTGPVVAGVIGSSKFAYDLWGDTVNVASRMESHGLPGEIQISDATRCAIGDEFLVEARGPVEIKGKGSMQTWFVRGARS
jgi:class 3 adenylate cyclase